MPLSKNFDYMQKHVDEQIDYAGQLFIIARNKAMELHDFEFPADEKDLYLDKVYHNIIFPLALQIFVELEKI